MIAYGFRPFYGRGLSGDPVPLDRALQLVFHSDSLKALKKALRDANPAAGSSHLSEATASGLGFETFSGLLAALKSNKNGVMRRPISEPAFRLRLQTLSGLDSSREALLAAAARMISDCLVPQNQAERLLIDTVRALRRANWLSKLEDDDNQFSSELSKPVEPGTRVYGLHVDYGKKLSEAFTAEVVVRGDAPEAADIPLWFDIETKDMLFNLDLGCIRKVLKTYDSTLTSALPVEEVPRRIQSAPIYEIGAFAKGCNIETLPYLWEKPVGLQVWSNAIAVTVLDSAGSYENRVIFCIKPEHYTRIVRVMRDLKLSYVATPAAVRAIGDVLRTGLWYPELKPVCEY